MPGTGIEPVQPRGPRDFKSKDQEKSSSFKQFIFPGSPVTISVLSQIGMLGGVGANLSFLPAHGHNSGTIKKAKQPGGETPGLSQPECLAAVRYLW